MKKSISLFIFCAIAVSCDLEDQPMYPPVRPFPTQAYEPPEPFPKYCDSIWGRQLVFHDLTWVEDFDSWGNEIICVITPDSLNIFSPCGFIDVFIQPDSISVEETAESGVRCCQPYEYFNYFVLDTPPRLYVASNHLNYQRLGKKATVRIKY